MLMDPMLKLGPKTQQPAVKPDPGAGERSSSLLARIENRTARVGIIGLGYVGLPLAAARLLEERRTFGKILLVP